MTLIQRNSICLLALVLLAACRAPVPAPEPQEVEPTASERRLPPIVTTPRSATKTASAQRVADHTPVTRVAHRPRHFSTYRRPSAPVVQRTQVRSSVPSSILDSILDRQIAGLHIESATSLRAAGRTLARTAHVNLVVDAAAEAAFEDAGGELTLVLDHPLRLSSALNLLTDFAGDDIAWTVRDGVVLVTTKARARGKPRSMVLDVRDLLWSPPSFAAPEMGVLASGMTHELPEPPERSPYLNDEVLLDAIRAAVAPGTWDDDGNSIEIVNGRLHVTHD